MINEKVVHDIFAYILNGGKEYDSYNKGFFGRSWWTFF